uniref:CUB domain-containing protein n=2 Tax=Steinernema glaseri TaxID=37863 RepID=A0A1I7Z616_9BILA
MAGERTEPFDGTGNGIVLERLPRRSEMEKNWMEKWSSLELLVALKRMDYGPSLAAVFPLLSAASAAAKTMTAIQNRKSRLSLSPSPSIVPPRRPSLFARHSHTAARRIHANATKQQQIRPRIIPWGVLTGAFPPEAMALFSSCGAVHCCYVFVSFSGSPSVRSPIVRSSEVLSLEFPNANKDVPGTAQRCSVATSQRGAKALLGVRDSRASSSRSVRFPQLRVLAFSVDADAGRKPLATRSSASVVDQPTATNMKQTSRAEKASIGGALDGSVEGSAPCPAWAKTSSNLGLVRSPADRSAVSCCGDKRELLQNMPSGAFSPFLEIRALNPTTMSYEVTGTNCRWAVPCRGNVVFDGSFTVRTIVLLQSNYPEMASDLYDSVCAGALSSAPNVADSAPPVPFLRLSVHLLPYHRRPDARAFLLVYIRCMYSASLRLLVRGSVAAAVIIILLAIQRPLRRSSRHRHHYQAPAATLLRRPRRPLNRSPAAPAAQGCVALYALMAEVINRVDDTAADARIQNRALPKQQHPHAREAALPNPFVLFRGVNLTDRSKGFVRAPWRRAKTTKIEAAPGAPSRYFGVIFVEAQTTILPSSSRLFIARQDDGDVARVAGNLRPPARCKTTLSYFGVASRRSLTQDFEFLGSSLFFEDSTPHSPTLKKLNHSTTTCLWPGRENGDPTEDHTACSGESRKKRIGMIRRPAFDHLCYTFAFTGGGGGASSFLARGRRRGKHLPLKRCMLCMPPPPTPHSLAVVVVAAARGTESTYAFTYTLATHIHPYDHPKNARASLPRSSSRRRRFFRPPTPPPASLAAVAEAGQPGLRRRRSSCSMRLFSAAAGPLPLQWPGSSSSAVLHLSPIPTDVVAPGVIFELLDPMLQLGIRGLGVRPPPANLQ